MSPDRSHQPVNLDTLEQIKNQLGEVFAQLIRTYIEQSDQLLGAMPALLEQQQFAELQRHAHSIKSSSLNLGAESLAELAQQLEILSEQACNQLQINPAPLQQLAEQIQQEYASLKPQLVEHANLP